MDFVSLVQISFTASGIVMTALVEASKIVLLVLMIMVFNDILKILRHMEFT